MTAPPPPGRGAPGAPAGGGGPDGALDRFLRILAAFDAAHPALTVAERLPAFTTSLGLVLLAFARPVEAARFVDRHRGRGLSPAALGVVVHREDPVTPGVPPLLMTAARGISRALGADSQ